jgi:hypothetical protein
MNKKYIFRELKRTYNNETFSDKFMTLLGFIAFVVGIALLPIHFSFKLIILGFLVMLLWGKK